MTNDVARRAFAVIAATAIHPLVAVGKMPAWSVRVRHASFLFAPAGRPPCPGR